LLMRILNAVVSYGAYIVQMIWPENLVALYPYHPIVIWQLAGAGALLLSATVLIIMAAKRFPYLLVGWFWYLGMLLPVIGLVQVGSQAHADRYTYLPQIGLYLIIAWGIRDLTVSWRHRQWILGCAAFVVITTLMIVAWIQTSYWRSTESLWSHTLACTSKNVIAHNGLGDEFARQGRLTEAIQQYQKSLEINPNFTAAYNNLGLVLAEQGRLDDAIQYYQEALEKNPDYAQANNNLGIVLAAQGRLDDAIGNFQKALEINPDYAEAHFNLGIVLAAQGRRDEAIQHYREALRLDPSLERARQKLRALGVEP
jgi:protein O-mannosyl-transferase